MTVNPRADALAEKTGLELLAADGLDSALLGYVERCGSPPCLVYDRAKCLEIFEKEFGDVESAIEWFEFNVAGSFVGELTPFYFTGSDDDQ